MYLGNTFESSTQLDSIDLHSANIWLIYALECFLSHQSNVLQWVPNRCSEQTCNLLFKAELRMFP